MFITVIISVIIIYEIKTLFFWSVPSGLVIYLGIPGSGKTTIASALVQKQYKKNERYNRKHEYKKKIYSNVPIINSCRLEPKQDLGVYDAVNGTVLIDEANLEFSNRDWKTLEKKVIRYTKLFRHYGIDNFIMFSQALDQDVTFRNLAHKVCIVRKSLIPGWTIIRDLKREIKPHEEQGDIRDFYSYKNFGGIHLLYRKPYYKFFDSFEAPPLQVKEWQPWTSTSRYDG